MSDSTSLVGETKLPAPVGEGERDAGGPKKGVSNVYLQPGKLYVTSEPLAVTTILGSCVAVCLWDGELMRGGVNHYLLPHGTDIGGSATRFGNVALERLLERMVGAGSRKKGLQAKLFGGARISSSLRVEGADLGERNVRVARTFLHDQGIRLVAEDVGGSHGRKLVFEIENGIAWIRRL